MRLSIALTIVALLIFLSPRTFAQSETVVTDIFKRQADSIVVVAAAGKRKKDDRSGSGFFISNDGLVVTNYHLIKKARRLFVKLRSGTAFGRVKVVNVDVPRDIAVLKVETQSKPVRLGQSRDAAVGQRVVAIGNPLGLESTVSDGLISAVRDAQQGKIFQISVPLSQGSSGGPLFNLKGEVIGIVTASMSQGQSLNFAIPIDEIKPRLARFIELPRPTKTVKLDLPQPARKKEKEPESKSAGSQIYVIQANDTLWDLAKEFNTTVDQLMRVNNLKSSKIIIGQKLRIP